MDKIFKTLRKLWNNSYVRIPFFSAVIVVCFFVLPDDTRNVFIPAVIGFFLSNLITSLLSSYKNSREDKIKSIQDSFFLMSIYYEEKPLDIEYNGSSKEIYYKVLLDSPKNIVIEHKQEMFMLDDLFSTFYFDILKSHSNSYIKNCETLRLYDIEERLSSDGETEYILKTQLTNYFDHLLTNRAIDYPIRGGASLRHIYEPGPKISQLKNSKFANQIGFNCMVVLSDNTIIIPRRGKDSTYSKNKITASLTGRLPSEIEDGSTIRELEQFIKKQANQKLKIDDKYLNNNSDFEICSITQNIYEGGKPQIYFLLKLNSLSSNEYFKARGNCFEIKCDPNQLDKDIRYYLTDLKDINFVGKKDKISIISKYDKRKKVKLVPEKSFYICLSYAKKYKNN